jgi:hypothetical protein
MTLSHISSRVQSYAQQLKELELERIKDLQNNGPTIFFDDMHTEVCVTLLREGKEKHIHFCEHEISVVYTDMSDVIEEFNLTGPPSDDDGFTYFLRANPEDFGRRPYGIWISKKEAIQLQLLLSKQESSQLQLLLSKHE